MWFPPSSSPCNLWCTSSFSYTTLTKIWVAILGLLLSSATCHAIHESFRVSCPARPRERAKRVEHRVSAPKVSLLRSRRSSSCDLKSLPTVLANFRALRYVSSLLLCDLLPACICLGFGAFRSEQHKISCASTCDHPNKPSLFQFTFEGH